MLRECAGDCLDFLFGRVIEMAARAENLDGFEPGLGNLAEEFGRSTFARQTCKWRGFFA